MSDAIALPPRPDLEQYKKLAKDLQRACRSSDPAAVREWAVAWMDRLTQLQGLELTPDLRGQVTRAAERMQQRWQAARANNRRPACVLADAQLFVAREHGFASWPTFAGHVDALARVSSPVSRFEVAADAIVGGDIATLATLLQGAPGLPRERSTREHHSTLLHYVSANGVEDFRQKTPPNIVEITRLLLEAGADVNAESDAYAGGSTTLGLAATSIHPANAGVQIALLETLLAHGARMDQPSAAGNAQSVVHGCIANGQPDAAEFLLRRGAALDFESAAALGRLGFVARSFDESGALVPPTTIEQLESGFTYACGYGRANVVDFLLARGVRPHSHRVQSGLHWAAYGADVEIVTRLLEHGWPVDVKHPQFQATPLELALAVWARGEDPAARERSYTVVASLARAGGTLDPLWCERHEDPLPGMAARLESDRRMQAALRGELSQRDAG